MGLLNRLAAGWRAFRASGENPKDSLDSLGDDDTIFSSLTGVKVSRRAALAVAAWFRAVNVISRYVAKTPVCVYKNLDPEGKERDKTHAAHKLLRRKFNPQMTAFHAKLVLTGHAVGQGNGYGYIRRKNNGQPAEIWPLLPHLTCPVRREGELWYVTQLPFKKGQRQRSFGELSEEEFYTQTRRIRAEDVIHIKGLGYDGLVGYNTVQYAAQTLGLSIAGRDYGSRFFKNSSSGRVVLQSPNVVDEAAAKRMLSGWNKMAKGIENAHRTVILEQGTTATNLATTAKDAQLLDLMKWTDKQVALWHNLPDHMVGGDAKTSYASLEQENQRVLDDAIDPWFCCWEEECFDKLLTEQEKDDESHAIEFLRQSLVRIDMSARYAAYNLALQGGWMSRDEVRARENLNPIPGGEGQEFLVALNMGVAGDQGTGTGGSGKKQPVDDEETDDTDPDEEDDDAERNKRDEARTAAAAATRLVFFDAMRRMATRMATQARKAASKPAEFPAWIASCRAAGDHVVRDALRPSVAAVLATHDRTDDPETLVTRVHVELSAHVAAACDEVYSTADRDSFPGKLETRLATLVDELPSREWLAGK